MVNICPEKQLLFTDLYEDESVSASAKVTVQLPDCRLIIMDCGIR